MDAAHDNQRMIVDETSRVGFQCASTLSRLRQVVSDFETKPADVEAELAALATNIGDTKTSLDDLRARSVATGAVHTKQACADALTRLGGEDVDWETMSPDDLARDLLILRWTVGEVLQDMGKNKKRRKWKTFRMKKLKENVDDVARFAALAPAIAEHKGDGWTRATAIDALKVLFPEAFVDNITRAK